MSFTSIRPDQRIHQRIENILSQFWYSEGTLTVTIGDRKFKFGSYEQPITKDNSFKALDLNTFSIGYDKSNSFPLKYFTKIIVRDSNNERIHRFFPVIKLNDFEKDGNFWKRYFTIYWDFNPEKIDIKYSWDQALVNYLMILYYQTMVQAKLTDNNFLFLRDNFSQCKIMTSLPTGIEKEFCNIEDKLQSILYWMKWSGFTFAPNKETFLATNTLYCSYRLLCLDVKLVCAGPGIFFQLLARFQDNPISIVETVTRRKDFREFIDLGSSSIEDNWPVKYSEKFKKYEIFDSVKISEGLLVHCTLTNTKNKEIFSGLAHCKTLVKSSFRYFPLPTEMTNVRLSRSSNATEKKRKIEEKIKDNFQPLSKSQKNNVRTSPSRNIYSEKNHILPDQQEFDNLLNQYELEKVQEKIDSNLLNISSQLKSASDNLNQIYLKLNNSAELITGDLPTLTKQSETDIIKVENLGKKCLFWNAKKTEISNRIYERQKKTEDLKKNLQQAIMKSNVILEQNSINTVTCNIDKDPVSPLNKNENVENNQSSNNNIEVNTDLFDKQNTLTCNSEIVPISLLNKNQIIIENLLNSEKSDDQNSSLSLEPNYLTYNSSPEIYAEHGTYFRKSDFEIENMTSEDVADFFDDQKTVNVSQEPIDIIKDDEEEDCIEMDKISNSQNYQNTILFGGKWNRKKIAGKVIYNRKKAEKYMPYNDVRPLQNIYFSHYAALLGDFNNQTDFTIEYNKTKINWSDIISEEIEIKSPSKLKLSPLLVGVNNIKGGIKLVSVKLISQILGLLVYNFNESKVYWYRLFQKKDKESNEKFDKKIKIVSMRLIDHSGSGKHRHHPEQNKTYQFESHEICNTPANTYERSVLFSALTRTFYCYEDTLRLKLQRLLYPFYCNWWVGVLRREGESSSLMDFEEDFIPFKLE